MHLYRVREMSDVFVDACVRDPSGNLLFLSCYGRDTALTQLFAAFSLPAAAGGLVQLSLEDDSRVHRIGIASADRLKKLAGRLPKENLFGNVAQTWIYDPVVVTPDRSNRLGWVMLDVDNVTQPSTAIPQEIDRRVWAMYQLLSPAPLLPTWEEAIRGATRDAVCDLRTSPFPPLGRIAALSVHLPDDFSDQVSQLVKSGVIGIADDRATALAA